MDKEKKFKTKSGYCHILEDKIVLTRDGITGSLSSVVVGNKITRILIIHAGLSLGLFYFAFDVYKKGQIVQAVLYGVMGFLLAYGIVISLNNSATPVIDRQRIKEIKFKRAIAGLTRSRFEVLFVNDLGKTKKRLILLPGSLKGGQRETEKAMKIMTEAKLITSR